MIGIPQTGFDDRQIYRTKTKELKCYSIYSHLFTYSFYTFIVSTTKPKRFCDFELILSLAQKKG